MPNSDLPPAQIQDLLNGEEAAFFMSPNPESPTPAESFVQTHLQDLLLLGLARYDDPKTGDIVVFNPIAVAQQYLQDLSEEGRLAELVNGAGNGQIPKSPRFIVAVDNGDEPVRDVLVESDQQLARAVRAASRNPNNIVRVLPAVQEVVDQRLAARQRPVVEELAEFPLLELPE